MRHQLQKKSSFGRHRGPRKALIRSLMDALVKHERIKTTLSKARCLRPLVEKAITLGKQGHLHSRRILLSRYPNKQTAHKIVTHLSPRFKDRPGGYTRIVKLGSRPGDQANIAYLEFVDYKIKSHDTQKVKNEKDKETEKKLKKAKNKIDPKLKKQMLKKQQQKRKKITKIQKAARTIHQRHR